jgi:hypothetical protein
MDATRRRSEIFFILGIGTVFATVGRGEIEMVWGVFCGRVVVLGEGRMGQVGVSKDERRNHGIDDGEMNKIVGVWLERVGSNIGRTVLMADTPNGTEMVYRFRRPSWKRCLTADRGFNDVVPTSLMTWYSLAANVMDNRKL